MRTKEFQGTLRPANPKAIKFNTSHFIYKALLYNNLSKIIDNDSRWYKGIIQVDAKLGATGGEIIETTLTREALQIINSLAGFLKAERIAELELTGTLTFTHEDSETSQVNTVRINVKAGNITYQQASFSWNGEVTVK